MKFLRNNTPNYYIKPIIHSGLVRRVTASLVLLALSSVVLNTVNTPAHAKVIAIPPSGTVEAAVTAAPLSFTHSKIITTYFWVGEPGDADNGNIPNKMSAWDESWQTHYGGVDNPSKRNGFLPAGFKPKENPFYFALPYSDYNDSGVRKLTATKCSNSAFKAVLAHYSWCKNTWIAIRHDGKIAYAQWEDVGPFEENDTNYVFGSSAPKNKENAKAGLDVSPAVRDYLKLTGVDRCDWTFVTAAKVPAGPWKNIVTTSKGESN